MRIMRDHPVIGEQILRQIPGMDEIATAVRHEHERWDGGGYPDGLAGKAIPLASRIVFACDAFHAMTSDRPYRRALDHPDAIVELRANAGTQFDPAVVDALLAALGDDALIVGCAPGDRAERDQKLASRRSRPRSAPRTCSSSARSPATPSPTSPASAAARAGPGNIELRPEDGGSGPSLRDERGALHRRAGAGAGRRARTTPAAP